MMSTTTSQYRSLKEDPVAPGIAPVFEVSILQRANNSGVKRTESLASSKIGSGLQIAEQLLATGIVLYGSSNSKNWFFWFGSINR